MEFLSAFLNTLFPSPCSGCGRYRVDFDGLICRACRPTLDNASEDELRERYSRLFEGRGCVDSFYALCIFTETAPVRGIIHSFKYDRKYKLARHAGELLGKRLPAALMPATSPLLIPVPLHRLRKSERGYNQSEMLARGVARISGHTTRSDILFRIRYTAIQATLKRHERYGNIHGAFKADEKKISGRAVVLIDDVVTTGATLHECARILKAAGAPEVHALAFAVV